MKLLIKQRVFSWTDSYDVYDEQGVVKYIVKAEMFAMGHKLHVCDKFQCELGVIKQKLVSLLPSFEIEINGVPVGNIQKKFSLFRPKYEVNYHDWRVEGDFLGWDYDVYYGCSSVCHISKEPLHWGDTYVIDYANPQDELHALMLVIAIDAANCPD